MVCNAKDSPSLRLPSADHVTCHQQWRILNDIGFDLLVKDHKYIDSSPCLGSRHYGYWLPYMYCIILEGANIPTNKVEQPGRVALTHL